MSKYGTLDKSYHLERKSRRSLKYRLRRRGSEVIASIQKHYPERPEKIVDLGAADGLMLGLVKDTFPDADCTGFEYSQELVESNNDKRIKILQGDINDLPAGEGSFDIAIATAIIEHLPEPDRMLIEAKRILRPGGLLILTAPDPFWEKAATMVGHLKDEQHHKVMNLKQLAALFENAGFDLLEKKKFMLSPAGMPLEMPVENIVRKLGLNFFFANQLLVGRKPSV